MNTKVLKLIGIATSVVGALATVVADWAGTKRQDAVIAEKVAEAIAKAVKKD